MMSYMGKKNKQSGTAKNNYLSESRQAGIPAKSRQIMNSAEKEGAVNEGREQGV